MSLVFVMGYGQPPTPTPFGVCTLWNDPPTPHSRVKLTQNASAPKMTTPQDGVRVQRSSIFSGLAATQRYPLPEWVDIGATFSYLKQNISLYATTLVRTENEGAPVPASRSVQAFDAIYAQRTAAIAVTAAVVAAAVATAAAAGCQALPSAGAAGALAAAMSSPGVPLPQSTPPVSSPPTPPLHTPPPDGSQPGRTLTGSFNSSLGSSFGPPLAQFFVPVDRPPPPAAPAPPAQSPVPMTGKPPLAPAAPTSLSLGTPPFPFPSSTGSTAPPSLSSLPSLPSITPGAGPTVPVQSPGINAPSLGLGPFQSLSPDAAVRAGSPAVAESDCNSEAPDSINGLSLRMTAGDDRMEMEFLYNTVSAVPSARPDMLRSRNQRHIMFQPVGVGGKGLAYIMLKVHLRHGFCFRVGVPHEVHLEA